VVRISSVILAAVAMLGGCGPTTFVIDVAPGRKEMVSTTVVPDGRLGSPRIALIDVSGMIHNFERPRLLGRGENPVGLLHEQLLEAWRDPRVRGVILRINSPGGTVTASDAMYREIERFRVGSGKPVVALMMDVAASGGYYVACAADRIVAYPTSVTGSIGVILQTVSLKPALNRLGIQAEAITSGPNKDAGSFLRAVLQTMVDDFYARFVKVVKDRRPVIPPERMAEVTDGRVVSGDQAVEMGLVDQAGDLYAALAVAIHMAGVNRADLVRYHRPLEYVGSPYSLHGGPAVSGLQVNLAQVNLPDTFADSPAGFYYLWDPGSAGSGLAP
jgi:protease-4